MGIGQVPGYFFRCNYGVSMAILVEGFLTSEASLLAHIVLLGIPRPAKLKKGRNGKIYNARKILATATKWKIKMQYRGLPYKGAVKVDYYFGFPIPKSWPLDQQELAKKGGMPHTVKPDYDNLEKLYNDCIKKIIIADDSQICGGEWTKEYTANPRTEILISYA